MDTDSSLGDLGAIFDQMFGLGDGALHVQLRVYEHEARSGVRRSVTFTRRALCAACGGTGRDAASPACATCAGTKRIVSPAAGEPSLVVHQTCPACGGRGHDERYDCGGCELGFVMVEESVDVDVPADTEPEATIVFAGRGHARASQPRGDLVVVLAVTEASRPPETTAYRGAPMPPAHPTPETTAPPAPIPARATWWTASRIVLLVAGIAFVTVLASALFVR